MQERARFPKANIGCVQSVKLMLRAVCVLCLTSREKKLRKFIEKGEGKLSKALDLRTIVRYQHALKTMLALFLTRDSRRLMPVQRRTRLLYEQQSLLVASPRVSGGALQQEMAVGRAIAAYRPTGTTAREGAPR